MIAKERGISSMSRQEEGHAQTLRTRAQEEHVRMSDPAQTLLQMRRYADEGRLEMAEVMT